MKHCFYWKQWTGDLSNQSIKQGRVASPTYDARPGCPLIPLPRTSQWSKFLLIANTCKKNNEYNKKNRPCNDNNAEHSEIRFITHKKRKVEKSNNKVFCWSSCHRCLGVWGIPSGVPSQCGLALAFGSSWMGACYSVELTFTSRSALSLTKTRIDAAFFAGWKDESPSQWSDTSIHLIWTPRILWNPLVLSVRQWHKWRI